MSELNVYWFRRGKGSLPGNFGDELGRDAVEFATSRKVVWADPASCDLASIGSILNSVSRAAHRAKRTDPLIIWGSGLMKDNVRPLHSSLMPILVRGHLTRSALALDRKILTGDPGIVSRAIFKANRKEYKWGVVPHFTHVKTEALHQWCRDKNALFINPTGTVQEVISKISSCHGVISSSLHGLIVADSYKIPCVWLNIKSHDSHEFKFNDYCSGVGRGPFSKLSLSDFMSFDKDPDTVEPFLFSDREIQGILSSLRGVV
ncbi:polysaccharide pyruvyl transferase family protein [Paracoccus sphaerophysae]|uniref:polysaccharide pyruvyl transferase family protein n=1 Tax=Paracoccus sphaerophysae TaxID=690417 RepID=UPI000A036BDF|nr:polysaccharide pyruvyl transferase family protein [Paracoccus sphaerophysae]